jgi:hypothetical protein
MFVKQLRVSLIVLGLLLICATASADPVLTLVPPTVSGIPGSTVGWGFNFSNSTNYAVLTASSYAGSFGTYTDLISSQSALLVAGPSPDSTTISQAFNLGLGTGVGALTLNSGLLNGQVEAANITVFYDLFSVSPNDPNFDPGADFILSGEVSALAQVNVVPEPSSLILLGSGLAGFAGTLKRRFKK